MEKEFKAYNKMRDIMDRKKFLERRKEEMRKEEWIYNEQA